MNKITLLLSDLIDAIRGGCWLNHAWQLTRDDDHIIEHVCLKCGKRAIRTL